MSHPGGRDTSAPLSEMLSSWTAVLPLVPSDGSTGPVLVPTAPVESPPLVGSSPPLLAPTVAPPLAGSSPVVPPGLAVVASPTGRGAPTVSSSPPSSAA